jgi:competence protein ComEC
MIVKKMAPVKVIGTIDSIEPAERGSRAVLKDLEIERLSLEKTPRKIRLTIRKDEGLRAGQRVKILAGLNPPSPPVSPGAFDFQFMAFYEGLGAVGFAYNQPEILEDALEPWLSHVRQRIVENIQNATSSPEQAVVVALMTGQRKAIREEDWKALRESGLAHMLAISGLHVGMVAGVLFFFSRLFMASSPGFALKYPIKKYAALIALIGACLYTLIVGATIPTQRALMMTGLVMVAIMLDRSPFSLRLIALAAGVILLISPEALLSVSFQMSFIAVASLICFYEWSRPFWNNIRYRAGFMRKITLYLLGISATTIIAGTTTGLFALYHFGQYPAYSLLANLVAVPLLAFIVMPLLVLSYILMPVGLEPYILKISEEGVSWILASAHWVANMDGAVWRMQSWPLWIFIGMVFCIWIWLVWNGRNKYYVIFPAFVIFTILAFAYRQPDIQISNKVDLVSIKGIDQDLWLSTAHTERYTAENWLRHNGQNPDLKKRTWPKEGAIEEFPLSCDSYGCRGEMNGKKISVAFSQKAAMEDCRWADLLISKLPSNCREGEVIDFFDIWRNGNHAIWLSSNNIIIKNVERERGNRPWTQTAARNKN